MPAAHAFRSNSHDSPHAELLYSQLQALGLNVFFDAMCLRLDEPWEPQIAAALSGSLVVVLLVSHASVEGASICNVFIQTIINFSCTGSANKGSFAHSASTRLRAAGAAASGRASYPRHAPSGARVYRALQVRRHLHSPRIAAATGQFFNNR